MINVSAGQNLQSALDNAPSGEIVNLESGATFLGNYLIRKPVTLQGKATLRTPNADPAIRALPQSRDVKFIDLSITNTGMVYDIVRIGEWQTSVLADVPVNISFERVDIFGQDGTEVQRGIAGNGANVSVLNSKIRGIHGKGYDAQAFAAWNGPGPFKLIDSYFEASGENVMFGGADTRITNLVPSNIEVTGCHFFKPLNWKGVWSVKNLFELKNARNVLIDNCIFENCWGDAQIGYAILFTVRNQDGTNPWAIVENVTLQNSVIKNSEQGIQTLGSDYLHPSQQCSGLKVYNNRFEGIKNWFFVLSGFHNVTIEHNTHEQGGNILVMDGNLSPGFVYRNNVTQKTGGYGFFGSGKGEGSVALDFYTPGHTVQGNVLAGMIERIYPTGNFFPPDLSSVSSFKGTDGLVPGYLGSTAPSPAPEPAPAPAPAPAPTTDTTPPVASVTFPASGATISGIVTVTWTATDNVGVDSTYLIVDGLVAGGDNTAPYSYQLDTTKLSDGEHVLYIRAWDKAGNAGDSLQVKFVVANVVTPEPQPAPQPEPVPQPAPVLLTRKVSWPKQTGKQKTILDAQWVERYRLQDTSIPGWAVFEQVL